MESVEFWSWHALASEVTFESKLPDMIHREQREVAQAETQIEELKKKVAGHKGAIEALQDLLSAHNKHVYHMQRLTDSALVKEHAVKCAGTLVGKAGDE